MKDYIKLHSETYPDTWKQKPFHEWIDSIREKLKEIRL